MPELSALDVFFRLFLAAVLGGAVQGGIYGAMPDFVLGGDQDASNRGVWIPTIGSVQFGATLGRSFQYMAGEMTGQGQDQYRAMMMDGGRTTKGNLHKKDNGGKVRCVSNKSGADYSKKA